MDAEKRQHLGVQRLKALEAGHHVLPHQHPQPVAVVIPPQRLDLDVLAQHVEAQLLHGADVTDHGLVRWRGVQSVGPVPLIQQPRLEIRLVVQGQHLPPLMLHEGEFPHAEIAGDTVLSQRDVHVVQKRVLRRPGPQVRRRNDGHAIAVFIGPALRDHRIAGPHRDAGAPRRVRLDVPAQHSRVQIRCQTEAFHVVLRHALQPHRLPDAAGGGVPDAAPLIALLAHTVHAACGVVGDSRRQPVLAVIQQLRDIQAERQIAALMAARLLPVHQHAAALIHRAEVQQHPLPPEALRQGKRPLVPQRLTASQLEAAAGQQALRRKGHQYLSGAAAGMLVPVLHRVVPQTIEAQIAVPHQLGPRVLRQGARLIHRLAPGRIEPLHVTAPPSSDPSRTADSAAPHRTASSSDRGTAPPAMR